MRACGVRGAITVKENSAEEIIGATEELLKKIVTVNGIRCEDVASIIFSVTKDLNKDFPARAARRIGWLYTPLFCTYEIDVPQSLRKCVRVLLHVNTNKEQKEIKNVYLGEAKQLRPDLGIKEEGIYYLSD